MQLVVKVALWMVQDGGEPSLAVGDEWSVDLVFHPDQPLEPANENVGLELTPERATESLARYLVNARVHRRRGVGATAQGLALEVPGVMFGYFSAHALPASPVVTGRGILTADRYARSVSWAFPEIERSCVVEEITLVTAPLIPSPEPPATHVPDWARRTETSIDRMRMWDDEPAGSWATYFVSARLLD